MRKLNTEELNRLSVEAYKLSGKAPVAVVLDRVRSGHNVGSVFRTCDAFGVAAVYLCGFTPVPPNREVMKTALGSTDAVDWFHNQDTGALLESLKQQNDLAVELFDLLLKKFPEYLPTYYQAANHFFEKGYFEKADEVFKRGIVLAEKLGKSKALTELKGSYQMFLDEIEE